LRPWIGDVGKHAGWPQEHIVFDSNAPIDRNVVLNFYAVAENSIVRDQDILSKGAIFSYYRTRTDVSKVPNTRAPANHCSLVDDSGWVDFYG
jgi:hypothetical protein